MASAALLLAALGLARADTIYLRGGERIIGQIISDKKTKIVIKSQALGRLEIPRDRVERVELDSSPSGQPAPPASAQPFIPTPPTAVRASTNTAAATTGTNAPAKHRWFWQRKRPADDASTDYSELNNVENVNNHRATESFDVFLTRRLFVRVPQAEYYRDPFQNIGHRVTAGAGLGYYLIDQPKVEWLVFIDLDISFIWDRIGNPQPDSSGAVLKKDDFRLNLSFGVKS
jgi:hypothetical protein